MNKYFQLYEYDHNLKARLAIFQLQGKSTLWWEEVKIVRGVREQTITWERFQRYFKERYLTEHFYDEKAREFHDLRLGHQTMDEFITRFTSLLRYVPYIREEKDKVQRFVSSLPLYMREMIEFDNPKAMDEAIHKARICYQQSKQKGEILGKRWNDKRNNKSAGKNKGNRSSGSKGVASTVDDIGRSLPRINVALDDRQTKYHPTMVEFEGKISDLTVAVLIYLGATLSYIIPKVVEHCKIQPVKFKNTWLVQLATGAKRRVLAKVNNYSLKIAGRPVMADLNVLPLSSYDVLIAQLAKCIRKGYTNSKDKTATLDNIPVIQEFADVFPEEIPGMPPKRDIDFTIELIPGATPISRAPYRMSTLELTELKM
eukprot:PITA_16051